MCGKFFNSSKVSTNDKRASARGVSEGGQPSEGVKIHSSWELDWKSLNVKKEVLEEQAEI